MKLAFNSKQSPRLTLAFYKAMNDALQLHHNIDDATNIVLNFFDPCYSPGNGGYHPVEIGMNKNGGLWNIEYITDFAYHGTHYPELAKEIDLNFESDTVYSVFMGYLKPNDADDLAKLFLTNFIGYYEMGAYALKVTMEPISEDI